MFCFVFFISLNAANYPGRQVLLWSRRKCGAYYHHCFLQGQDNTVLQPHQAQLRLWLDWAASPGLTMVSDIPSECAHSGGVDALIFCREANGLNPHPKSQGMRRLDPKPSCKCYYKFTVSFWAGHSPPWATVFSSVLWGCWWPPGPPPAFRSYSSA